MSTRETALEIPRTNSATARAAIRGMRDEQPDMAAPFSLNADAPLPCQFFLGDHPVRRSHHYHASIRAALAQAR